MQKIKILFLSVILIGGYNAISSVNSELFLKSNVNISHSKINKKNINIRNVFVKHMLPQVSELNYTAEPGSDNDFDYIKNINGRVIFANDSTFLLNDPNPTRLYKDDIDTLIYSFKFNTFFQSLKPYGIYVSRISDGNKCFFDFMEQQSIQIQNTSDIQNYIGTTDEVTAQVNGHQITIIKKRGFEPFYATVNSNATLEDENLAITKELSKYIENIDNPPTKKTDVSFDFSVGYDKRYIKPGAKYGLYYAVELSASITPCKFKTVLLNGSSRAIGCNLNFGLASKNGWEIFAIVGAKLASTHLTMGEYKNYNHKICLEYGIGTNYRLSDHWSIGASFVKSSRIKTKISLPHGTESFDLKQSKFSINFAYRF